MEMLHARINLDPLESGDHQTGKKDIETVVNVRRSTRDLVIKVIVETGYLTTQEEIMACRLAKEAGGAYFVKTCTVSLEGPPSKMLN